MQRRTVQKNCLGKLPREVDGQFSRRARFVTWTLRLCLGFLTSAASAQELFVGGGGMHTPTLNETSWAFPYGYKYYFNRCSGASMIWLNEGHVTGHHRDGSAWEAWLEI